MNNVNLIGAGSVSESMKEMIPNWSFTTNKEAQNDPEVKTTVEVPQEPVEEVAVEDQAVKIDGSWLV